MAPRKAKPKTIDARIRRVLKYLDSPATEEMVGLYKETAREQHGSVEAMLKLDEKDMAQEYES
jgi:hypothetical protein